MSTTAFNTKSPTVKRILKEAKELSSHPDPSVHAAPLDTNLFEWHFTLSGPPGTAYSEGTYHGRIILPPSYPLRPPSFRFLTPTGRFEVNREICLSISGHHEETWQPAWGIRTALWALRAFMEGDAKGQVGGMEMPEKERQRLANESRIWSCQGCGGRTNHDILKEQAGKVADGKQREQVVPAELRMGFGDQMKRAETETVAADNAAKSDPATAVVPEDLTSITAPVVAQTIPTTILSSVPAQPTANQPAVTNPGPTTIQQDNVPPWIDKAITGIGAALVLAILKKILL